ncbi:MAG: hypothetical protein ACOC7K_00875 [bacterium]
MSDFLQGQVEQNGEDFAIQRAETSAGIAGGLRNHERATGRAYIEPKPDPLAPISSFNAPLSLWIQVRPAQLKPQRLYSDGVERPCCRNGKAAETGRLPVSAWSVLFVTLATQRTKRAD